MPGSIDTVVYQFSSQRTILSPNPYLYYDQVRATTQHSVSLSLPQQLPRGSYGLDQVYYNSPHDHPALPSFNLQGTYEPADPATRDEGMFSHCLMLGVRIHTIPKSDAQSTHSLPSQQSTTQPAYFASQCNYGSVENENDDVGSDSLFFESRRESQFGGDDGEETACIHGDKRED